MSEQKLYQKLVRLAHANPDGIREHLLPLLRKEHRQKQASQTMLTGFMMDGGAVLKFPRKPVARSVQVPGSARRCVDCRRERGERVKGTFTISPDPRDIQQVRKNVERFGLMYMRGNKNLAPFKWEDLQLVGYPEVSHVHEYETDENAKGGTVTLTDIEGGIDLYGPRGEELVLWGDVLTAASFTVDFTVRKSIWFK